MEFSSRVHGLDEINKLLKALPDKPARQALESGLRAGGNILKKEAVDRAPVLQGKPRVVSYRGRKRIIVPGLLKKSIIVRKVKVDGTGVHFALSVTKLAFFAHFIEWGTRFISAQPFMRPALDLKGEAAIQKMRDTTIARIAKETEKLAGILGTNKRRSR